MKPLLPLLLFVLFACHAFSQSQKINPQNSLNCNNHRLTLNLGGGMYIPASDAKNQRGFSNGSTFNGRISMDILKISPKNSIGVFLGGTYISSNKSPVFDKVQSKYFIQNGQISYLNTAENKANRSGYSGIIGIQGNFNFKRFSVQPLIGGGFMQLKNKSQTIAAQIQSGTQKKIIQLYNSQDGTNSGFLLRPEIKLGYQLTRTVGIWASVSNDFGPTIKINEAQLIPGNGYRPDNIYTYAEMIDGKKAVVQSSSKFQVLNITGGLSFKFGCTAEKSFTNTPADRLPASADINDESAEITAQSLAALNKKLVKCPCGENNYAEDKDACNRLCDYLNKPFTGNISHKNEQSNPAQKSPPCTCGSWGIIKYSTTCTPGTYNNIPGTGVIPGILSAGSTLGIDIQYDCSPSGCATAVMEYQLFQIPSMLPIGSPVVMPSGTVATPNPYCFTVPCRPNAHNPFSVWGYMLVVRASCGGNYCGSQIVRFQSTFCPPCVCGNWNTNDSVTTILGGSGFQQVPYTGGVFNYSVPGTGCVPASTPFQAKYSYTPMSPYCVTRLTYSIYRCGGVTPVVPSVTQYSGIAVTLITPPAGPPPCCYELRVTPTVINNTPNPDIVCPIATLQFNVCCSCSCGSWGIKKATDNMGVSQTIPSVNYTYLPSYNCSDTIKFDYKYNCTPTSCAATYQYQLFQVSGGGVYSPYGALSTASATAAFSIVTPASTGNFAVKIWATCGGSLCDTAIYKFNTKCPPPCTCGGIDSIRFVSNFAPQNTFHCGDSILWANPTSRLIFFMSCAAACTSSNFSWTIYDMDTPGFVPGYGPTPVGAMTSGFSTTLSMLSPSVRHKYKITLYPNCGGTACTPCRFTVQF